MSPLLGKGRVRWGQPVNSSAAESGFNSLVAFCMPFKQTFSLTPFWCLFVCLFVRLRQSFVSSIWSQIHSVAEAGFELLSLLFHPLSIEITGVYYPAWLKTEF